MEQKPALVKLTQRCVIENTIAKVCQNEADTSTQKMDWNTQFDIRVYQNTLWQHEAPGLCCHRSQTRTTADPHLLDNSQPERSKTLRALPNALLLCVSMRLV